MKNRARHLSTATLAAAFLLTACGNAVFVDNQGVTGASLNEEGELVVHVQPCGAEVDLISVNGEFDEGTEANPQFAQLEAGEPVHGPFTVNVEKPAAPWTATVPAQLPGDPEAALLISSSPQKQNEMKVVEKNTGSVHVTTAELRKLAPGEIYVGWYGENGKAVTEDEFLSCD